MLNSTFKECAKIGFGIAVGATAGYLATSVVATLAAGAIDGLYAHFTSDKNQTSQNNHQ